MLASSVRGLVNGAPAPAASPSAESKAEEVAEASAADSGSVAEDDVSDVSADGFAAAYKQLKAWVDPTAAANAQ